MYEFHARFTATVLTCVAYEFHCYCFFTCVVYEFYCHCSYLRCVRVLLSLFLPVLCTSFTATVPTCVVYEFHCHCSYLCCVRVSLLLFLPALCMSFTATVLTCAVYEFHCFWSYLCCPTHHRSCRLSQSWCINFADSCPRCRQTHP